MSENNVRQLLHGINPVPLMTNHTNFKVEDEDEEFVIEKILGKNNVMKNVIRTGTPPEYQVLIQYKYIK